MTSEETIIIPMFAEVRCNVCGTGPVTFLDYITAYDRDHYIHGSASFEFYCHSCRNRFKMDVTIWDIDYERHLHLLRKPDPDRYDDEVIREASRTFPKRPTKLGWLDFGYRKRLRTYEKKYEEYISQEMDRNHQKERELSDFIDTLAQKGLRHLYPPISVNLCECCGGSGVGTRR